MLLRTLNAVIITLLFTLLSGCASKIIEPARIPGLFISKTEPKAYLWRYGYVRQPLTLTDYAVVKKIDNSEVKNSILLSKSVLEVPTGEHAVEILYKEEKPPICGYLGCVFLDVSRETLTLVAEKDHVYVPFATDTCSRIWFWIEDWGFFEEGKEAPVWIESDFTQPVVAGKAPEKIDFKCKKPSDSEKQPWDP